MVCKDDSVALMLNGPRHGSTLWQQSSDRITWSNASGDAYNDSLIFIATTTLYYRATVIDGSCSPFYSDTVLITLTACPPPYYCTDSSTCNGDIIDSRDSQIYKTVQIGSQCWMAQNLNVGTMIQGSDLQTRGTDNQNADIQKYCYNDGTVYCTTYGGLYLWDEMMAYDTSRIVAPGPQGICPTGWHLPTDNEWKCLEMSLGMSQTDADKSGFGYPRGTNEGGKLKKTTLWTSPNEGANNKSGFTALPGGLHGYYNDNFSNLGYQGSWWTATEFDAVRAWQRILNYNSAQVERYYGGKVVFLGVAESVRCVKD